MDKIYDYDENNVSRLGNSIPPWLFDVGKSLVIKELEYTLGRLITHPSGICVSPTIG